MHGLAGRTLNQLLRIHIEELRQRLGLDSVVELVRKGRFQWFVNHEHNGGEDHVKL